MNFVFYRNTAVIIFPNSTVDVISRTEMVCLISIIDNPVKPLVMVVDDFDGRRRGQVAFEDINAVTFKVVVGKFAQFGEQLSNTFRIFHGKHSLRFCAGRGSINGHGKPLRFRLVFLNKSILARRLFVCKEKYHAHASCWC